MFFSASALPLMTLFDYLMILINQTVVIKGSTHISHMTYHVITHKKPLYVLLCYVITYKVKKYYKKFIYLHKSLIN